MMKHMVFLIAVLLQFCVLANAQAWTLTDVYRDGAAFLDECILATASGDDSQEARDNEGKAEEEEPDCD